MQSVHEKETSEKIEALKRMTIQVYVIQLQMFNINVSTLNEWSGQGLSINPI